MKSKDLWDYLIRNKKGILSDDGKTLTPVKKFKINGSDVVNLINEGGKISVNIQKVEILNHPGENIDYSLYGTPRQSMGD